jgi:hypothetical protein
MGFLILIRAFDFSDVDANAIASRQVFVITER